MEATLLIDELFNVKILIINQTVINKKRMYLSKVCELEGDPN